MCNQGLVFMCVFCMQFPFIWETNYVFPKEPGLCSLQSESSPLVRWWESLVLRKHNLAGDVIGISCHNVLSVRCMTCVKQKDIWFGGPQLCSWTRPSTPHQAHGNPIKARVYSLAQQAYKEITVTVQGAEWWMLSFGQNQQFNHSHAHAILLT